jgi:hypothetical protein
MLIFQTGGLPVAAISALFASYPSGCHKTRDMTIAHMSSPKDHKEKREKDSTLDRFDLSCHPSDHRERDMTYVEQAETGISMPA